MSTKVNCDPETKQKFKSLSLFSKNIYLHSCCMLELSQIESRLCKLWIYIHKIFNIILQFYLNSCSVRNIHLFIEDIKIFIVE